MARRDDLLAALTVQFGQGEAALAGIVKADEAHQRESRKRLRE